MSNDNPMILLPSRSIRPGHALVVTPDEGHTWVGPMIHRVEIDADMGVVRLWTVNGGETTRDLGSYAVVVDTL